MSEPAQTSQWAPIAVFAYNRPDKLSAMMSSLRACDGFAESPVTIFVDGPKRDEDRAAVSAVQDYVQQLALPNVTWSFRETNVGLRNSIFAGVRDVVDRHGRAIVLEDDLVLSKVALSYFNTGLTRYAQDDRVWSIVGYAYDAPALSRRSQTLALPFAHPWGWATWGRAWDRFQLDNRPPQHDLDAKSFARFFDMNGLYPFTAQLKSSIAGQINSWFIHWYYTVFQHGGVSIFPPRRLVDNHGFSDGSHGGALNPYDKLVKRPGLLEVLPEFDDSADVDYAALDVLRDCWELRVQRFIAGAGRAKRKIRSAR
jgi:hypothetical protein